MHTPEQAFGFCPDIREFKRLLQFFMNLESICYMLHGSLGSLKVLHNTFGKALIFYQYATLVPEFETGIVFGLPSIV